MCGIIAYIGGRPVVVEILIKGILNSLFCFKLKENYWVFLRS